MVVNEALRERMRALAYWRWSKVSPDERSGLAMGLAKLRNAKLTPERKAELGRHAATARWAQERARQARSGVVGAGVMPSGIQ